MWMDEEGRVFASPEFSNMKINGLNQDETALLFCTEDAEGLAEPMMTLMLNANWKDHWTYDANKQCFYSKSIVNTGITTPTLLEAVKVSSDTYNKTEGYTLRIDVLTDAVQTTDRQW